MSEYTLLPFPVEERDEEDLDGDVPWSNIVIHLHFQRELQSYESTEIDHLVNEWERTADWMNVEWTLAKDGIHWSQDKILYFFSRIAVSRRSRKNKSDEVIVSFLAAVHAIVSLERAEIIRPS